MKIITEEQNVRVKQLKELIAKLEAERNRINLELDIAYEKLAEEEKEDL